jgi:hypothetical protein
MYREAIKVFRQVGDLEGLSTASGNLGYISLAGGNLTDAARARSDAIPGYKEMEDKDGVALTSPILPRLLDGAVARQDHGQPTTRFLLRRRFLDRQLHRHQAASRRNWRTPSLPTQFL